MIGIKVCGLTDPLNARDVADAGADFVGFIFYRESKRFVGEKPCSGLFVNIPEKVRKVAVFVDEEIDKVMDTVKQFDIRMVQLHGNETPAYCMKIRGNGIGVIKTFGMHPGFEFNGLIPYIRVCDFFMFDTKSGHYGGSGEKFDWELLYDYDIDKPFFLSGGIGPGDLQKIREFSHRSFYSADINSRFESEPGIKDTGLIKTFIHDIKNLPA